MIATQLDQLELLDSWQEEGAAPRWRAQFPLLGAPGVESMSAVYFEIEPGEALPIHTDSEDEIVVLLSGSGEGQVGDEMAALSAGGFVFVPAQTPHGFRNTGDETLRAFGVFAGAHVISTFEHPIMPLGISVIDPRAISAGV